MKSFCFILAYVLLASHMFISICATDGLKINYLFKPENCDEMKKSASGDHLYMHYTGSIDESSKTGKKGSVFDSSRNRNQPFSFVLGQNRVIKGWEQGLLDMCVGEKRQLIISPELGYGDRGTGKDIPGGATLRFDVECMKISGSKSDKPPANVFKDIDTNGDNEISYKEFENYFVGKGKEGVPRGLWEKEDKNGDLKITFDEFSGPKGLASKRRGSEL